MDAVFNVAIRTLLLRKHAGEMGVGSGIVSDSGPLKEYMECRLKTKFLSLLDKPGLTVRRRLRRERNQELELIETMRWDKQKGFFLISYHLKRLKDSAGQLNFHFNKQQVMQELTRLKLCLNPEFAYRVRLGLSCCGKVSLNYRRIREVKTGRLPRVMFAKIKTNSRDIFLYHKTTRRKVYDQQYRRARQAGFFDALFENQKGEITEGAISNVFIKKNRIYYTPPVRCGLLAGVYRSYFMKKNAARVKEKVLKRKHLMQADAVYLSNSVRGMTRVSLR
jgi:para-aminobenzoate synthetase/4-amino-4-deoxychorismate lyase